MCLGSFYKLRLPDASLDFALLSEAFHHADDPLRLLAELRRTLKPKAPILMLGEHIRPSKAALYSRTAARYAVSRLLPVLPELLAPQPITGDHYYLLDQYREMFARAGFSSRRILTEGCSFQRSVLSRGG